jgi:PAS domain S-box-containing protein
MRDTTGQDADKTREQLTQAVTALRRRLAELEAKHMQAAAEPDAMPETPRNSDAQYRATLDAMSDMIHVVDDKLQIILTNDALRAKNAELGLPTDVVGRTVYDIYPFLPPKVSEEYAEVFEHGRLLITEESTPVGDREIVTETRKIPIRVGGKVSHVVTVMRDITERKRAEDAMRQQAETLEALHETALDLAAQRSLPDLLRAIVVRAAALLKVNGGGLYLYRPDSDDLELVLAYNLKQDFAGAVLRRGEGLSGKVLASRGPLAVADYSQWAGQARQYTGANFAAVVGVPIVWGDRLLGVVNVVDDAPRSFSAGDIALLERFAPLAAAALENNRLVGDLRDQMDKLKQAQMQLIQAAKLAAVGELAAGVAHELNNPLTSVLGFAELLLHAAPADDRTRLDLETIANQARRARNIVRNLLDFARQSKPQRLPANVAELLHQTLELIRRHMEGSGVVIEEEYAPDIGALDLDSGQMKQVFLNLITNAAQAMPRGGKLKLRIARQGDEVAISVSDTGHGIPPDVRDRIFEPFFSTKPAGQGTGLGLSISLGIVQEHGGRISVESQVGQGSTFTVWLPAEPSRMSSE